MITNPPDFEYIRTLVATQTGIILEESKNYLVESRLSTLVRISGFSTLGDFINDLKASSLGQKHKEVVEAMLTNETLFFRDDHPFETIRTCLVPELLKLREAERHISIWCCACSTGQEPYSVAMLIKEHFGSLPGWKFHITASDLSTKALRQAREGKYSEMEVTRGLPSTLRDKFFARTGDSWQIDQQIRSMVNFRELNITVPFADLPKMDIVFLRNVLIYFNIEQKRSILDNVKKVIQPDGYLLLGGSETTLNLNSQFERVQKGRTDCYRVAKQ